MGETAQEVLSYLEAQGASKVNTIATALHKSFTSVWNALLGLKEKSKVTRGADKKWDIWRDR